jgi:hypothetical protein
MNLEKDISETDNNDEKIPKKDLNLRFYTELLDIDEMLYVLTNVNITYKKSEYIYLMQERALYHKILKNLKSCFIKKNISDFSVDISQNIDDNGVIKLKVSMSMSVYVFVCMIIYVRVCIYMYVYIYMYHVLSKKILVILVFFYFSEY